MSSNSENDKSYLLALLLFLGAGFLVFSYIGQDGKGPKSNISKSEKKKIEDNVNKHLMHTNDSITMQQQRMAVENARLLYESDQNKRKPRPQAYANDTSFDLSYETRAYEVARDLGHYNSDQIAEDYSPEEVVQKEMYDQMQNQKQEQAYRAEYARQFVENARRGGYKIELSEDLSRVKSVKEIKKDGQMELFGSRGEALR